MDWSPLLPDGDDNAQQSDSLNDSAAEENPCLPPSARAARFEALYRSEFGPVCAYFARRSNDPQLVADLIAETFVAAIHAFDGYDADTTSVRAWTLGLARRVYARYRESDPREESRRRERSIARLLDESEAKELIWWIDVEQTSRELIMRLSRLSAMDRDAIELVDLCGLSPGEAARELGISSGQLRVRVLRTRARLRREGGERV
jgi:RNA polymerase sigma factor (sigma-70 family)